MKETLCTIPRNGENLEYLKLGFIIPINGDEKNIKH